jgi:hypothetical protein
LIYIERIKVSRVFLVFDNLRVHCLINWSLWSRWNFHRSFLWQILTLVLRLRFLVCRECCRSWIWRSFSDLIYLFIWLIFLIELIITLLDSLSSGLDSCRLRYIQSLRFSAVWRSNP